MVESMAGLKAPLPQADALAVAILRGNYAFAHLFLSLVTFIFVRDGIPSVADYDSTLMGVVVVVVVVVVVAIFTMG